MSKTKEDLIASLGEWLKQAEAWMSLPEEAWRQPLAPGKWTGAEALAHLLKWDDYFLQNAIRPAVAGELLTLIHVDFDTFNLKAAEYGRATKPDQLLQEAIAARSEVVDLLQQLPADLFLPERGYLDGAGHRFDLEEYIVDFASHDKHHLDQLRAFFSQAKE
ncbi:DinB family protein [Gorillibacterium sp. CAU 1737]|uniref:DinB family protein n=1 Tax=Gorillibacterium sp. CAU 1737 TaxID=3140362 RepID=UPI003260D71D